jgi:hypothetical protein
MYIRWSHNLAYAIGIITTDGNLSKDGRHINVTSKDKEQVQNIARVFHVPSVFSTKNSSFNPHGTYYVLQFSNVSLYRFLENVGLYPNKTKTIGELQISDQYFADFLRGHLDGDGFTYSYWDRRWKSSFMFYTGFLSASKIHLLWIQREIRQLYGLQGYVKFAGKSTCQLMYAKKNSLQLLKKIYAKSDCLCLKRKRFKINRALGIIRKQAGMLKLVYRHA